MYAWNHLRRLAQVGVVAATLVTTTPVAAGQASFAEPSFSSVGHPKRFAEPSFSSVRPANPDRSSMARSERSDAETDRAALAAACGGGAERVDRRSSRSAFS